MELVTIRTELGLTQEVLAERLGVSPGHIGDLERGRRHLTLDLVSKLEKLAGRPGIVAAFVAEKLGDAA